MYLEHYGLAEAPFRITPHTDFFFSGANRGATLEALLYAITHDEGIVKISGEVGSGKTMLCRVLMERLPPHVVIVYLANPSLSRDDILFALADELGIPIPEHGRAAIVMRALQEKLVALYAEGKQVVALIDEAHAMPIETLEEIRLLSNLESNRHKLLQLVLFGQPELDATLARDDMRQLRERITQNFSLEPLVRDDIAQYLDFRMRAAGYRGPNVFSEEAIKLIAKTSAGLTRRINILADKALLASYASGTHSVGANEVRAAIKDSDFPAIRGSRSVSRLGQGLAWAMGGAVATLGLMGLWQFLGATDAAHQPPTAATAPATPAKPENSSIPPTATAADKLVATPPTSSPGSITPPETIIEKTNEQKAHPNTPLLDKLLAESRPWLNSVPDSRWFIQLNTTDDSEHPERVEVFLQKTRKLGLDMDGLRVYLVKIGEIDRYGVIYGDFASRQNAVKAIDAFPAELKRARPYPRQAVKLRLSNNTNN